MGSEQWWVDTPSLVTSSSSDVCIVSVSVLPAVYSYDIIMMSLGMFALPPL